MRATPTPRPAAALVAALVAVGASTLAVGCANVPPDAGQAAQGDGAARPAPSTPAPGEPSMPPAPEAPPSSPNPGGSDTPDAPAAPEAPDAPPNDDGSDPADPADPPVDDAPAAPDDDPPPDGPPDAPPGGNPSPPPSDPEEDPAAPSPPANEPAPDCRYPAAGDEIAVGRTLPRFRWATARDPQGNVVDFDMEDFHCDPAWADYSVAAFIIGTGWCSACVEYDAQLAPIAQDFERAGGLFVFVQVEDANYSPADSATAFRIVQHSYGDGPGLRVGDADTQPSAMAIGQSPIVGSYPSAFVVRRSDMRVLVDQASSAYTLDFVQLARDAADGPGPDPGDAPDQPGPAPGGACTEEVGEPNDDAGRAVPLSPGELSGGVCDAAADYYEIGAAGAWHVDLLFQHAAGDLDLYVWDAARGDVAYGADGRPLGSDSVDDDEALDGFGPSTLVIVGWEGARAPYRLRLSER